MTFDAANLILNEDGSIYHLQVLPEDVAPTVILVGDPDRVSMVSRHFDRIDVKRAKREFVTHTGSIGDKRMTVMSTGIGTDNIDIVLNELDAVVNIDLKTGKPKEQHTSLDIIRIGTSGSIHPDIPVDSIVVSKMAVGTDALGHYMDVERVSHPLLPDWAYLTHRGDFDLKNFGADFTEGITLTCPGFYGPQGRMLRTTPRYKIQIDDLYRHDLHDIPFTNLEMETSGIYLFAHALGHRAISFNAILANRIRGTFSKNPGVVVERLIEEVIGWRVRE